MTSGGKLLKPGWNMTEGQHQAYWRGWGGAVEERDWGQLSAAERDVLRYDCHERASREMNRVADEKGGPRWRGEPRKSAKEIHYLKELDYVFAEFKAIRQPADLNAQIRVERMDQTRLLHKVQVEQLALLGALLGGPSGRAMVDDVERGLAAERYVTKVMLDGFGTVEIGELKPRELEGLRSTLARAISRLRQERRIGVHDLHQMAGLNCPRECALCASVKPVLHEA